MLVLLLRPPLSLRRKDAIVDLSKHLFAVPRVGFGGPLTRPGQSVALESTGNRRFGPLGLEFRSGRGWGGNLHGGRGLVAEDVPTPLEKRTEKTLVRTNHVEILRCRCVFLAILTISMSKNTVRRIGE